MRKIALLFILTSSIVYSQSLTDKWNDLSVQFYNTLEEQQQNLMLLQEELTKAKGHTADLDTLLIHLQMQNDTLASYNAQIAMRMQERDEELVQCYDELTKKGKQLYVYRWLCVILFNIACVLVLNRIWH